MPSTVKLYGQSSLGQIHARSIDAHGESKNPPLVCLHPAPSSGLYFSTVLPLLNQGRRVIAPDYPGYGGSDRLSEAPEISDYATAMLEFLDSCPVNEPFDILGFHSGCLVAVEMAHLAPGKIRRLVLCDVPYFDTEQRAALYKKMATPMELSTDLDCLAAPWAFNITGRTNAVPLPRAFDLFAEQLRAGNADFFGFAAAFSYNCETKFATLNADVTLLATQSGLHDPTEKAGTVIPDATFTDVPEVTTAVFEQGAVAIAKRVNEALNR